MSLVVVLEEEDSIILRGKIFQFIPGASFETFQSLIFSKLISEKLLSCILDLILEFQLILGSHLHFDSFLFLLQFVVVVVLHLLHLVF